MYRQNEKDFFPMKKNHRFFLSVEGNIGAGKSTFLYKIAQSLGCPLLLEPCHEWQDINGHNLLSEFYKDIKRWAYSFQLYAFLTRIESIEKKIAANDGPFFISERSIFADRYVFAQVCHQEGKMNELEWNMYKKWFDWTLLRKNKVLLPSGIIYLQVDPAISYHRIELRGREEEKGISFDYLNLLDKYHRLWLIEKEEIHEQIKNIPVLVINCDEDFEHSQQIWESIVNQVEDFIKVNYSELLYQGDYYGNATNSNCSFK